MTHFIFFVSHWLNQSCSSLSFQWIDWQLNLSIRYKASDFALYVVGKDSQRTTYLCQEMASFSEDDHFDDEENSNEEEGLEDILMAVIHEQREIKKVPSAFLIYINIDYFLYEEQLWWVAREVWRKEISKTVSFTWFKFIYFIMTTLMFVIPVICILLWDTSNMADEWRF